MPKGNHGRVSRPRGQNIKYIEVPGGGFLCPHLACRTRRVYPGTENVRQHLLNVHRIDPPVKLSNLGKKFIILYRWNSTIRGAEQMPATVATLLALKLTADGHEPWIDRHDLAVDSDLKDVIRDRLQQSKVAVICIGPGDLERCSQPDDFFRWEINNARQLEHEGRLKVVIVAHGTNDWKDFICGTSMVKQRREKALRETGEWGSDILKYLTDHYVIQYEVNKLDTISAQIIKSLP